jgi:hypothetical protein
METLLGFALSFFLGFGTGTLLLGGGKSIDLISRTASIMKNMEQYH